MQRFVFLKISQGDFDRGFDVTLKIASPDRASFIDVEIDCELPPNSQIPIAYQNWFNTYQLLPNIFRGRIGRTVSPENVHQECYDLAKQLKRDFQTWLKSSTNLKFQRLRETLCDRLEPEDEIFVFIQTQNEVLKKLPWQEWDLFRDRFPKAEIALSPPEIENSDRGTPRTGQNKVRILSILGDKTGIDTNKDKNIIESLEQAEPEFLLEPDRQQFSAKLWEKDWDILFFAGHSIGKNESGIIYLNPQDKLPIEELRNSLKKIGDRGLQLAIFNSCDGLKLAEYLAELNIPQIIIMREPVTDRIAQLFLEYFLQAYSQGEPLYLAVRQARSQLEAIEKDIPGATWLPIIYQKSLEIPPTWEEIVHGTPPPPFQQIASATDRYYLADGFPWKTGIPFLTNAAEFMANFSEGVTMRYGLKVAFSPKLENPYFISGGSENLKIWEMKTWENTKKISIPGIVDLWFTSVAISPDTRTIAACKQYKIMVWKLGEEKPIYTFSKTPFSNFLDVFGFDGLEFSPDGKILAANDNQDIKLWNLETGQEMIKLIGHSDKVTCIAFHPQDARILASCSYDKTIKIWRVDTGKSIFTLSEHIDEVYAIAFSSDGQILASGGKDNTIQLWSIYSGELPKTLRSHSDAITCLAFNPDGRTLVSGSNDETLIEWTITGKQLYVLPQQHDRGVTSVSFSPNGETLISGGRDQTIKIWQRSPQSSSN
ncbi:CHAT domain-containing protein [Spirulina sp. 06S082]|uniref:WD40 domain-containing protein n=1 Tax=Spirulina sp. 06S082 TaxID=3110248 RepID=UPI002B1FA57A|nr:CHAT domain-containing protein [Spirulina sp. 06S082]MEA5467467.1 CHAT domain-containing protein [Spirulina sp. 06S082]